MTTLERGKRLSESMLYALQREFFATQGINAWINQVPFYETSNPFIANCYAQTVFHFMCDWCDKHPEAKNHPFYILEIGTGSGRFSFYVLKKLNELLSTWQRKDIQLCYIMSDFSENHLEYYQSHPKLKSYIDQGILDFAIFNMEEPNTLQLKIKNITLTSQQFTNPLIAFANYLFDTTAQDTFFVKDQELMELTPHLTTEDIDDKDPEKKKLNITLEPQTLTQPYYADTRLNTILEEYRKHLDNSSFLLPIAGFKGLDTLMQLANNKLMLITSDKGYTSLSALKNPNYPEFIYHENCFSMGVNYHAVSLYFNQCQGHSILQPDHPGLKTAVFYTGFDLSDFTSTQTMINEHILKNSPAYYYENYAQFAQQVAQYDMERITAYLYLSGWDPQVFLKACDRLYELGIQENPEILHHLEEHIPLIIDNYYYVGKVDNIYFEVAVFYHAMRRHFNAAQYYFKSIESGNNKFVTYYNLAVCLYYAGDIVQALDNFHYALELNPQSKETTEWIKKIS